MAEPNVGRQAVDASRRRRAAEMRNAGYMWPEIADTCGYDSPAHAFADVVHGLRADRAAYEETVDDLRELERARLERYTRMAEDGYESAKVAREDYDSRDPADQRGVSAPGDPLRAVETLRKLSVDRSKLLGLEAPKAVEQVSSLRLEIVGVDSDDLG